MNIIAQEAKKRQSVVKLANRKGKVNKQDVWSEPVKRKTVVQAV